MSIKIFFKAIPYEKKLVTLALESGTDGILAEPGQVEDILALGRTQVFTPSEIKPCQLQGKADEEQAATLLKQGEMVLLEQGWEIIPVENLLAENKGHLGLEVNSLEQAILAAGILEKGVDFIVVRPQGAKELKQIVQELKLNQGQLSLKPAKITKIQPIGLGHRVCVDTCSLLKTGQGLLVGNSSNFAFLVNAETENNPYVAARPFRINAGAVHAYTLRPGDRTSYLEELRAGSEVMIVDHQGQTALASVGRVKIEVRPLLLIEAEAGEHKGGIVLQNAETIRLVGANGTPVSVVALQEGDEVLAKTDATGRHFGMRIKETIEEK